MSIDACTELRLADDDLLLRYGQLLTTLARQHGLSQPHLGADQGEITVTVESGADGFDLAEFEIEAQNLLHARIAVTSAGAPGARMRRALGDSDASPA